MAVLVACLGGGVAAGLLLGLEAGDSIPPPAPSPIPASPAAGPRPAAPPTGEDALLAESIGHSLARSSGIETLAECERLREELREGCRRYVRERERAAPEANLLGL